LYNFPQQGWFQLSADFFRVRSLLIDSLTRLHQLLSAFMNKLDPLLIDAHKLFNDIFQWQRLTIEGSFDAEKVPPVILKRLATVAGLPSAKVLLEHLGGMCGRVREVFRVAMDAH
jgi:hypothetical protein